MSLRRTPLLCSFLFLLSCDGDQPAGQPGAAKPGAPMVDHDEIPLQIDLRCPGDPGCEDSGDGKLYAGVGKHDITPIVEPFTDLNKNGVWDAGEPFEDKNGNGKFDAYWMAGYGTGRLAHDVHDPTWARALALRQNRTTVVVVAVDVVGLFYDEIQEARKLIARDLDGGISLFLVAATHCHETADTMGAWGPDQLGYGVNEIYRDQVRRGIAAAASDALRDLREARVSFGSIAVEDGPMHDMTRYVSDTRDPVVIDNVLHTMHFVEAAAPDRPIGTLINWAHHPESAGAQSHSISSDWVHFLREKVEERGGGTVLYLSGALGGQIGPGRVRPLSEDKQEIRDKGFPMAEAIGKEVAGFALNAMADPGAKTLDGSQAKLSFRTAPFHAQIQNRAFHLAMMLKIYRRAAYDYDPMQAIGDDNLPAVATRTAYLRLGPAAILTSPGELLPELFIGGYDGRYAGTYPFIDKTRENAPDVSRAPQPPYLIDLMDGERPHRQLWGLAFDELGYIVPRYNFVLDDKQPYLNEARGDHYEETNSLGPLAEPQIVGTMRQLVQAR